jgi:hypothetical protein
VHRRALGGTFPLQIRSPWCPRVPKPMYPFVAAACCLFSQQRTTSMRRITTMYSWDAGRQATEGGFEGRFLRDHELRQRGTLRLLAARIAGRTRGLRRRRRDRRHARPPSKTTSAFDAIFRSEGHRDRPNADPGAERECIRGTLGRKRSQGVPRSTPDVRAAVNSRTSSAWALGAEVPPNSSRITSTGVRHKEPRRFLAGLLLSA